MPAETALSKVGSVTRALLRLQWWIVDDMPLFGTAKIIKFNHTINFAKAGTFAVIRTQFLLTFGFGSLTCVHHTSQLHSWQNLTTGAGLRGSTS